MPASSCTFPRQMFPPPTTIATETPARLTSAISLAIASVVLTSTPVPCPAKASPEIFNKTREKRGPIGVPSLTKGVPREAPHAKPFAQRSNRTINQIADGHCVILDEGLIEQAALLKPLIQFALNDFLGDLGTLPRRYARAELAAQSIDHFCGHAIPIQILRRHCGNVHRDVAGKLCKLRISCDEIGFAIHLDQHADLAAGVDVTRDEPFIGLALGFLCRLRRAALEQERFRAFDVAGGVEQRFAAIHHRRARLFTQRFDLFRPWLV